jgi:uncharacterized repeat protein (TIGR03803 family)
MIHGKKGVIVFLVCLLAAATLPAQTLTTLYSFAKTDGQKPVAPLLQGFDGKFYGTTSEGGFFNGAAGTVFQLTPTGTLTTVHTFCTENTPTDCADGAGPQAGLVQAANGRLYGTTWQGGTGAGTVFEIASGKLTTLYNFCSLSGCTDGAAPYDTLVQTIRGDFYGTTPGGGTNGPNDGTVFKITASGALTTLYSFCSQGTYPNCTDGYFPYAGLVQGTVGDFFGTTLYGGTADDGTVFRITASGTLTTLHSFCSQSGCTDGTNPYGGLVQGADGDLYGTTTYGGVHGSGTVFKITPSGALTTLYSFCSQGSPCRDGGGPRAALVQATDGNFYGVTDDCGGCGSNAGTIFKITPSGALTTLYIFCTAGAPCTDGGDPVAALIQATDGNFYGTTQSGGFADGFDAYGTVFRFSVGLAPFVKTLPTSGTVGALVIILGNNLTGATSVTLNGSAAAFTVNSSGTAISTTVPAGATSGTVRVVTPSGMLSSNVPFRVLP